MSIQTRIENNGRDLVIVEHGEAGTRTTRLTWATSQLADQNRERAIALYQQNDAGNVVPVVGQRKDVRRLGWLFIGVLSGPPTWWWPRVAISRRRVLVGWLRRGYEISWRTR